jgi:hypothetical protein
MTRNELGAPSLVMDDLKGNVKAKIRENMRITISKLQKPCFGRPESEE